MLTAPPVLSSFTITCARCKVEQHFGETCDEYQERSNGQLGALQKWMDEGNAKRCPRCNTIVQKTYGCNHMECPGCFAHFCWICLAAFADSGATYAHLTAKHDGWFDEGDGERGFGVDFEDIDGEDLGGLACRGGDARAKGTSCCTGFCWFAACDGCTAGCPASKIGREIDRAAQSCVWR